MVQVQLPPSSSLLLLLLPLPSPLLLPLLPSPPPSSALVDDGILSQLDWCFTFNSLSKFVRTLSRLVSAASRSNWSAGG
jgi:hypothetical protein